MRNLPKHTYLWVLCLVLIAISLSMPSSTNAKPRAQTTPYATATPCPFHDRHEYHGLWNESLGCHYDHTHGDDPHSVDDIFGTGFYEWAEGEIGYAWQTPGENHVGHKHESYKWVVRRDIPCDPDPDRDCVKALRAQVHADLTNVISEYHSFYVEAHLCPKSDLNDCGIIRFGGWQHSGDLKIDGQVVIDTQPPLDILPEKRHFDLTDNRNRAVWYLNSPSRLARVNFMTADMWGYYPLPEVIPITGTLTIENMVWFTDTASNGSRFKPYSAQFDIPYRFVATLDPESDGYADYVGWVDRYGEIVTNCDVAPYWDCVPVSWEHVKLPAGSYMVEFGTGADLREYDIYFGNSPSGWIEYPN